MARSLRSEFHHGRLSRFVQSVFAWSIATWSSVRSVHGPAPSSGAVEVPSVCSVRVNATTCVFVIVPWTIALSCASSA